jgi:hypothetical protein
MQRKQVPVSVVAEWSRRSKMCCEQQEVEAMHLFITDYHNFFHKFVRMTFFLARPEGIDIHADWKMARLDGSSEYTA